MRAAIDIGSNSVRLYVETGAAIVKKELDSTALGEGLALTGVLSPAAMDRTAAAVVRFTKKARALGAEPIFIFATEAVRAAKNGREFAARIQAETGIEPDVVSGETEARLGLMGALDPAGPTRRVTVVDIGGASVEIVSGNRDEINYARSLPLGMIRLLDLLGGERENIEKYAAEKVAGFGEVPRFPLVAIGGTATSLAAMYLGLSAYDPQKVHGAVITREGLSALTDRIFASGDRLRDFPTLSPRRALVIGHGAVLLAAIMRHLSADSLTVSERDNLEGYLLLHSGK